MGKAQYNYIINETKTHLLVLCIISFFEHCTMGTPLNEEASVTALDENLPIYMESPLSGGYGHMVQVVDLKSDVLNLTGSGSI